LDRSSVDLPQNLRPLPAPVGQRPFLCRPRPCCSTQSLETRNLRKVAGVSPGRPAQIALQCEAGVGRSRQADREDGKVRLDLDSPEGRLAALEVLGVIRYNEELAKTTSREMVVATAAGHEIVTEHSPCGLCITSTGPARCSPSLKAPSSSPRRIRHELSGSVSRLLGHSRGGPPGTPATHRQRDVDAVSRDCGDEDNGGWLSGRNGRKPRFGGSPREGPECAPKPPFHCEREYASPPFHRSTRSLEPQQSVAKGGKWTFKAAAGGPFACRPSSQQVSLPCRAALTQQSIQPSPPRPKPRSREPRNTARAIYTSTPIRRFPDAIVDRGRRTR
jgi:hypothetical protein